MNIQKTRSYTDTAGYLHLWCEKPVGYKVLPGQYCILQTNPEGKKYYFAFASAGDRVVNNGSSIEVVNATNDKNSELFFLIKKTADNAELSTSLSFIISSPMGAGFQISPDTKQRLIYITHGSGISAMTVMMHERLQKRHTSDILIYGIASQQALPALSIFERHFPLEKYFAYSKQHPLGLEENRIQEIMKPFVFPDEDFAILLVGSKEMTASCREILAEKNIQDTKIFSNY